MKRVAITPRADWQEKAVEYGFYFHTMYDEPYWSEDYYYEFTEREIDELESATNELHQMSLEAVDLVVNNEALLKKFRIPENVWGFVSDSWHKKEPSLYGRFDFAYDGKAPPKMLEYNADTPTSLYESAFFQWIWLEDQIENGQLPEGADQFNSIQEKLIERFAHFKQWHGISKLHFTCCSDTEEDRGTIQYLQDCALDADLANDFLFVEDIGITENGQFTDVNDELIRTIFKLYPWEFMFREEFANYLDSRKTLWVEPGWKSILSNKAILPLLWSMFPNHPNLLESYFAEDSKANNLSTYVKKPLFSREGANISIVDRGSVISEIDGPYGEEGYIVQAYYPLPKFEDNTTLVGSWVVGDQSAGICIREDKEIITQDLSRFYPHAIIG